MKEEEVLKLLKKEIKAIITFVEWYSSQVEMIDVDLASALHKLKKSVINSDI